MVIIQIRLGDKEYLDSIKEHHRETYGDLVSRLIECWKKDVVNVGKPEPITPGINEDKPVDSLLGTESDPQKVNDELIKNGGVRNE